MSNDPKNNSVHPAPEPVQIIISFDGQRVSVTGPIDNPILCYGMLECARQTVAQSVEETMKSRILKAPIFQAQ